VKPCREPGVLNGENERLVGRRREGRAMSLPPVCLVEARMPDESWEGTLEGSGVRSKRRMAGRGVDGEGRVPRTARVCARVSSGIQRWDKVRVQTHFHPERVPTETPSDRCPSQSLTLVSISISTILLSDISGLDLNRMFGFQSIPVKIKSGLILLSI
jgi:hypothetical protein